MAATVGTPPNIADILTLQQSSSGKPLVRLVQQAAQSIASASDVAITFGAGSEEIDTHGFHDTSTNPSRITPTVAGYYRLDGTVWLAADTDIISIWANPAKNGLIQAGRTRLILPSTATASTFRSWSMTARLSANGTTDYFELIAQQVQASPASLNTYVSLPSASVFECEFLRPL